jgi:hypothetical protein
MTSEFPHYWKRNACSTHVDADATKCLMCERLEREVGQPLQPLPEHKCVLLLQTRVCTYNHGGPSR